MRTNMTFKRATSRSGTLRAVQTLQSRPCRPAVLRSTRLRVVACDLPALPLDWSQIKSQTKEELRDYHLRGAQVPSTSPTTTLPTEPDAHLRSKKSLVLYRDTNAWCPYCQRVWLALEEKGISYDTVFINLRDKPQWYVDAVPSAKVPAIGIHGKMFWESKDILLLLEDCFPDVPLLPVDEALREEAMELMEVVDSGPWASSGFTFLTAGAPNMFKPEGRDEAKLPELRATFEEQLQQLEELLGRHPGPFLLGEQLTIPDVMIVPNLERLAAGLAAFRSFSMDAHPAFPHVAAWFSALRQRPAYQRTGSDSTTTQLVFGKLISLDVLHDIGAMEATVMAARREAAGKVAANKVVLMRDIVKRSGLTRFRGSPYGRTVVSPNGYDGEVHPLVLDAVNWTLLRLASYLLTGQVGPRPGTPEQAQVGVACLAYLRSRVCAPRDMSAPAAEQIRAACDVMLANFY